MKGSKTDDPGQVFPEDGTAKWKRENDIGDAALMERFNQKVRKDYWRVVYTEGPGDKAWMEERDRNYLTRIAKAKLAGDLLSTQEAKDLMTPLGQEVSKSIEQQHSSEKKLRKEEEIKPLKTELPMNFFNEKKSPEKIILCGNVETGSGDFSGWMKKFSQLYQFKTGVLLFPGTLNIRLSEPFLVTQPSFKEHIITIKKGEQGYGINVYILPCVVNEKIDAFILRPQANELNQKMGDTHSAEVLEIACHLKLRDELNLKDGDEIKITLGKKLENDETPKIANLFTLN